MSIRHAILGLLAEGPLHGYELRAAYERDLVPNGKLNVGQVYTTLDRLSRDGLVSHNHVRQSERPDKKVFEITPAGRNELDGWFHRPSRLELDLRNETFLKFMLALRLDVNVREVIESERRECFRRLHDITHARGQVSAGPDRLRGELLLDLAALRLEAYLKWLDHSEKAVLEAPCKREKPK